MASEPSIAVIGPNLGGTTMASSEPSITAKAPKKPRPNCLACSEICSGLEATKVCNILKRTSTVLSKVLNEMLDLKERLILNKARYDENRMLCGSCSCLLTVAFNARRKFLNRIKEGSFLHEQQRINSSQPTALAPVDPLNVNLRFSEASIPFSTFTNVTPGLSEASTSSIPKSSTVSGSFGTSNISFLGKLSSTDSNAVDTTDSQTRSVPMADRTDVPTSKGRTRLTREFQSLERCCNCHDTVLDQVKGRRLADVLCRKLIPPSGPDHGGSLRYVEVTVLGSLDIIFEVKRNSQFSSIVLDENYCLCNRCTAMLITLFDFYLHFIDSTKSPSFLKSTLAFNETLSVFQNSLKASDESRLDSPSSESVPARRSNIENAKLGSESSRNIGIIQERDSENLLSLNEQYFQGTDSSNNQLQLLPGISGNIPSVSRGKIVKHPDDRRGNRICLDCFMVFTTHVALSAHQETHKNPIIFCPHCKAGFHCKWTMNRHQRQVHRHTVDTQAMLQRENRISTEYRSPPGEPAETCTQKYQVQSALLALWEEQRKNIPVEPVISAQPIQSPTPPLIQMQATAVNHPENHYAPQLISTANDSLCAEIEVIDPIPIARIQKKKKCSKKKQSGKRIGKAQVQAKKKMLVSVNSSLNRKHTPKPH